MKTKNAEVRSKQAETRLRGTVGVRPSAFRLQPSRRGVALVITLILLSVTLIMAIAFLAVARRERNAVTTTADTTTARLAADTALAAAQAQIAANVLSGGAGAYNYGLLVSTNYINAAGFFTGVANVTNVNYGYLNSGGPLTANDLIQNVANLYFLPRAPVFVATNQSPVGYDFRYYLDLNRNGEFDTNGQVAEVDGTGAQTGNTVSEVGDPEWVGILEHPDQPHGPNNKFIARCAFFAQPIGNSLDLNAIYNQTITGTVNPAASGSDGYFRNEGEGSWELNLAAFLADLNTNQWNGVFAYNEPTTANLGVAFDDARSLLSWRYANSYSSLALAPPNAQAVASVGVDSYTLGNLMTNTFLPGAVYSSSQPWAGSDNPNRYFSLMSDIFDPTKNLQPFATRLGNASTYIVNGAQPSYDRYTYYRLLNEMGTDTAPDDNRMNLNYRNMVNGMVVPGMETNAIPWEPLDFFTNAANLLLQHYTTKWITASFPAYTNTFGADTVSPFGVTNIPVYIDGQFVYTPAVNRLLQLAANMYDASTNKTSALGRDYPSVFRPLFSRFGTNVFITGFVDVPSVTGQNDLAFSAPFDIESIASSGGVNVLENVYGVPWIIGAKHGFPSFDEAYSFNSLQLTRKLQLTRPNTASGPTGTNEMFIMSITNNLGFSFWNSYNGDYNGNLTVYLNDNLSTSLTNGLVTANNNYLMGITPTSFSTNFTLWPGSYWTSNNLAPVFKTASTGSVVTASYSIPVLPESQYSFFRASFVPSSQAVWETGIAGPPLLPQMGLLSTNRLQAFILDGQHVIDYVQFRGPNSAWDLNASFADSSDSTINRKYYMWSTNSFVTNSPSPNFGVVNQIDVSLSSSPPFAWANPPSGYERAAFRGFFFPSFFYNGKIYYNTNLTVQVPYTATTLAWQYTLWQANDPLVHFLANDLNTTTKTTGSGHRDEIVGDTIPTPALAGDGDHYQPWGRNQQMPSLNGIPVDLNPYNLADRDPLVWGSDFWDFPAGKYPTVGWLGRVHRGTPWQTVYLKATNILSDTVSGFQGLPQFVGTSTWAQWTGDTQSTFNGYFDAINSAPVQDSDLFDLFSTSLNGNATRGTLSVNQPGLAAWSAVFSGLVALTNITADPESYNAPVYTNVIISPAGPAGNNSVLGQIVNGPNGINVTRANFTNADGVVGAFEHVGDILRVPALAEQSPFLNLDNTESPYNQVNAGISDEVYEWLPQQTLGLLRAGSSPRYVVYCYGQTLRPAVNGEVLNGSAFGLYTNYQITAETAARAVIRLVPHVTATGTNYQSVIESFNPLPPN